MGVLGDVLTSADKITFKGRLGPGQMVCADLSKGTFQNTIDLAKEVAAARPYSDWLSNRYGSSASVAISMLFRKADISCAHLHVRSWAAHQENGVDPSWVALHVAWI